MESDNSANVQVVFNNMLSVEVVHNGNKYYLLMQNGLPYEDSQTAARLLVSGVDEMVRVLKEKEEAANNEVKDGNPEEAINPKGFESDENVS